MAKLVQTICAFLLQQPLLILKVINPLFEPTLLELKNLADFLLKGKEEEANGTKEEKRGIPTGLNEIERSSLDFFSYLVSRLL